jgi:hypothetical protein
MNQNNMSPEQRQIEELQKRIEKLERAENIAAVKAFERNSSFVTQDTLNALTLANLADVSGTSAASTGQVLKKTATTWQPGTDNTA